VAAVLGDADRVPLRAALSANVRETDARSKFSVVPHRRCRRPATHETLYRARAAAAL